METTTIPKVLDENKEAGVLGYETADHVFTAFISYIYIGGSLKAQPLVI